MLNGMPMALYNLRDIDPDLNEEDIFVPEVQELDNVCFDIKSGDVRAADYFGHDNRYPRHTCLCLDGDDSYVRFPKEKLNVAFKQGLIVNAELLVCSRITPVETISII